MHTIIHPLLSNSRKATVARTSAVTFRQPVYDCREHVDAMKLVVYVPGVDAAGVEIEASGTDITVTARKPHIVRVNWQALHLENAQRDYRLRLRLGTGFEYSAMAAEIHDGVLTVTLPKRAADADRLRRVA